jgi:hypothetical protein
MSFEQEQEQGRKQRNESPFDRLGDEALYRKLFRTGSFLDR